jgi:hypothetical protein
VRERGKQKGEGDGEGEGEGDGDLMRRVAPPHVFKALRVVLVIRQKVVERPKLDGRKRERVVHDLGSRPRLSQFTNGLEKSLARVLRRGVDYRLTRG